jgi:hypothetical protein
MNKVKLASELLKLAKKLTAGSDLHCPHCGENLGKQSEYEANADCVRGKKCQGYCGTCGKDFTFRAVYGA